MDLFTFTKEELVEAFQLENVKVRGENLMSRCPNYHNHEGGTDDHQSFGINLTNGYSNCFSCGIRGLSLRSLARQLEIDLPEAVLLKCFGIKTPTPKQRVTYKADFVENPLGAYMKLKDRGVSLEAILKTNTTYEEATDRIIFPAIDPYGNLNGWTVRSDLFTGRYGAFPVGVERKYLLFGLYPFAGTLHLVEGNVDALKLISWGYYAVATCGNFISQHQAETLLTAANKIVLVPDIDDAGRLWYKGATKMLKGKIPLTYKLVPKEYKDVGHKDFTEEMFNKLEEKLC